MVPLNMTERLLVMLVSAGLGYATGETVFYFVGAGVLFNVMFAAFERRQAAQSATISLNLDASGQAVQSGPYAPAETKLQSGSPLITAYFIAVLTALGAVLYMLPGHGSGIP